MNLRFVDWIWHVRGSVALAPGQSGDDAFDRLDPLFHERGTSHERMHDTLTFRKKDQPAQDKMSVFDSGVLQIEHGVAGPVLRYHLISRALLFCFLAPLMFVGIAQLTIAMGKLDKPPAQAAGKAVKAAGKPGKAPDAKPKPAPQKAPAPKKAEVPMNPLDKALGAPAPEKPGKDGDKAEGRNKKPSPTPAYVFAGIFATLYVVGRILEDRLVRALFRKWLLG